MIKGHPEILKRHGPDRGTRLGFEYLLIPKKWGVIFKDFNDRDLEFRFFWKHLEVKHVN